MRSSWQIFRGCFLIVSVVGFFGAPGAAWSQDLKKKFEENSPLREQLFTGAERANPKSKMHDGIIQASAEFFILRVSQRAGDPDKLLKEFSANVTKVMDKNNVKNNTEFRRLYGVALVGTVKGEVGRDIKEDPTSVVHSAALLPILARLKNPYVNEYLITLIEDNKTHDAVRLYALKALKETMPIEAAARAFRPQQQRKLGFQGQGAERP